MQIEEFSYREERRFGTRAFGNGLTLRFDFKLDSGETFVAYGSNEMGMYAFHNDKPVKLNIECDTDKIFKEDGVDLCKKMLAEIDRIGVICAE